MSEKYESKRTIEEVFDMETGEIINSKEFFNRPESEIYKYRRLLELSIKGYSSPKFVCLYCNQLLKLTGKSTERGKVSFFAHLHDSDDCEIKTEGENKLSKKEIELLKYSKIQESQRHKDLKKFIFNVLNEEPSTRKGIVDINMEKRIFTRVPFYNWRQPDISFNLNGQRIVLELQLSTTFLGVVVERDVFYKMNNTFIIWVFNFSDNQQFVNLGSMMCKDIYYSNKRNAFILDNEAMRLSLEKGELVLKCVWFEPKLSKGIFDLYNSIRKEEFITLDQLIYDRENFKPFYVDADKLFGKYQPLSLNQRKKDEMQIEKDIRKSLSMNEILNPIKKSGSWGFENDRKEIVIQPIYSEVLQFKYGVSWVKKRYWGAIDINGRRVVNFEFKTIQQIDEIDCIVAENKSKNYGVLSSEGFNIIPFEYSLIKYSGDEIFNVTKNGRVGLINKSGDLITENKTQITENIFKGSRLQYWGLEDQNKKTILPFIYSKIGDFVNGVAVAERSYENGFVNISGKEISDSKTLISENIFKSKKFGLWGIEDKNEEIIIPFEFSEMSDSIDGKVIARNDDRNWGVFNLSGEIVIPFEYYTISNLSGGKFLVNKNGYEGVLDFLGEVIIPADYTKIESISDDKIRVFKRDKKFKTKCGVLDVYGNTIIPIEYDQIGDLKENKIVAKKDEYWGVFDINGNVLIPFEYGGMEDFKNEKAKTQKEGLWGFIDGNGDVVIPIEYKEIGNYVDGKVPAKRDNWGVIDINGEVVVPFIYNYIKDFFNGRAIARLYYWGIIDENGKVIVPFKYDEIKNANNGRIKVCKDYRYGVLDLDGEVIISCEYSEIEDFVNGKSIVRHGYWGVIDEYGKVIVPIIYNKIKKINEGIIIATTDSSGYYNWGAIDENGKVIISFDYTEINSFIDGVASVVGRGCVGHIDINGNIISEDKTKITPNIFKFRKVSFWGLENNEGEILLPCEYNEIGDFEKGLIKVNYYGKWGLIDEQMNIVVPLEYSNILDFVNGKAIAQSCENNRWGVINEQGLIIIPFEYSVLENFIDGKAKAKKYSSWGVIDESGQTVISFEYEELEYVIGGKIKAKKSSGWGIISEKEEIILPFEYSHIGEFEIDKIKVVKNSEWGYVDFNGNELIEDILEIDKGIFRGKKCGLYGLTDSDNNTIIDFKYNEIKEFVNGYAKVRKNKNWGEVDTYGNVLICNEIELKKGILRGKKFGKYGLQTIDGIEILAFEYDEIGDFINGIAHASIDRKTLYVADNGETFKYSYLEPYSEGKALGFGDIDYGHGRYSIPKRRFNIIQSDCFKQYQIRVQINSYEDYGCFLELHDARGLLHISEIKKANKSLYDIGSLNEYVNVYIESVDVGQQRISFSLLPPKQKNEASNIKIHAIPKTSNLSDYINKDITGVITGIQNYGLFVKIEDGTNGLLHISKFKRRGVKIDKYIIGESIKVSVVSIDQERNRIELDFN